MSFDITINVASDFSRFPSGRTPVDSAFSGELFRQKFLVAPLQEGKTICIQLDGAVGYGSSFLEEAFGGLVRANGLDKTAILQQLHFESFDDALIDEIRSYIGEA